MQLDSQVNGTREKSHAERPRMLVLTPRYPYPIIGGDRLRIYYVCKELSRYFSITLLSLCETRDELHAPPPGDDVFARIERIYLPRWRSRLNSLLAIPTGTPLQVAYYRSAAFRRRVRRLLTEHDVCLAHLIRTGDFVRRAEIPCVLEMTDAISMNYERVACEGSWRDPRTWVYRLEARRLAYYERTVIFDFPLVTLVSSVDRDFLLRGADAPHVLVCSNGVDLDSFPYREHTQPEQVMVFIGNMKTAQNMDACMYFIKEVLPLLRQQGNYRLRVIGRVTYTEAVKLTSFPGVEVRANVDDVSTAVGSAFAGVAPIRLGAGVQNKVLEYMALGLPTVTTSVGLEGLQARDGVEVLVADEPPVWAAHLHGLYENRERALSLARAARMYVEEQHLWRGRLAPMVEAARSLCRR